MGRLSGAPSGLTAAPLPGPRPEGRGTARARGYDSRWDREAKAFKQRNPLCLGCEAAGRTTPTTITDHIVPHRGNMQRFWEAANWQPSCDWHHSVVKQELERMFDAGEIGVDDLRLDSPKAQAVAVRLAPGT